MAEQDGNFTQHWYLYFKQLDASLVDGPTAPATPVVDIYAAFNALPQVEQNAFALAILRAAFPGLPTVLPLGSQLPWNDNGLLGISP